jgi:hypothetical protein
MPALAGFLTTHPGIDVPLQCQKALSSVTFVEPTDESAALLERYQVDLKTLFQQQGYDFRDSMGEVQQLRIPALARHTIFKFRRVSAGSHQDQVLILIVSHDGRAFHLITLQTGMTYNLFYPKDKQNIEIFNQILSQEQIDMANECVWLELGLAYLRISLPFLQADWPDSPDAHMCPKARFNAVQPRVRIIGDQRKVVLTDDHPSRLVRWTLTFHKSGLLLDVAYKLIITNSP